MFGKSWERLGFILEIIGNDLGINCELGNFKEIWFPSPVKSWTRKTVISGMPKLDG